MAHAEGDKPKFVMLHRNVFDHCFWQEDRKFSQFEAWLDLIATARYAEEAGYVPTKGVGTVWLERGQLVGSVRFLSKRWNWGGKKVRGYIERLKKMSQITTHLATHLGAQPTTVITITNFDTYNSRQNKNGTPLGTPLGTHGAHTGHTQGTQGAHTGHKEEEGKKGKREKGKKTIITPASGDAENKVYITKLKKKLTGKRLTAFEQFWKCFAYPKGKADAADSWLNIPELTNPLVATICKAAEQAAIERPAIIAAGQVPKYAQGWITAKRWEDYDEDHAKPTPKPALPPHNWQEAMLKYFTDEGMTTAIARYETKIDFKKFDDLPSDERGKVREIAHKLERKVASE